MIRAIIGCFPSHRFTRAGFLRDARGVSAVEFAMILPVMMVLYRGGVEISRAISINRKVTLAARTMADLVAQVQKVNATDIGNVLTAGESIAWPFNDASLKLRVSNVKIDPMGVAKVEWSRARNRTPRANNETVTVPAGINIPNTSLVWGEVEYLYTPQIGGGFSIIKEGLLLHDQIYMRPRLNDNVACDNC